MSNTAHAINATPNLALSRITPAPASLNQAIVEFEKAGKEYIDYNWPEFKVETYCAVVSKYFESFRDILSLINSTAGKDIGDPDIGAQLMPLALASWAANGAPSTQAQVLLSIYQNVHGAFGGEPPQGNFPTWIQYLWPQQAEVISNPNKLPEPDYYCTESAGTSDSYTVIATAISEKRKVLEGWSKQPKIFEEQIPQAETQIQEWQEEIIRLATKINDVNPLELRMATATINMNAAANKSFLQAISTTISSLEGFISAIVKYQSENAGAAKDGEKLVAPSGPKEFTFEALRLEINFPPSVLSLQFNSELLAYYKSSKDAEPVKLLNLLTRLRVEMFALISSSSALGIISDTNSLNKPLQQAFASDPAAVILRESSSDVQNATAALYSTAVLVNGEQRAALEIPQNLAIFDWAIKSFWTAPTASERWLAFDKLLSYGNDMQANVAPICKHARQLFDAKDITELARYMNEQIVAAKQGDNPLTKMAVVSLLRCLAEDKETSRTLAHQMPDLELIKIFSGIFARGESAVIKEFSKSVSKVLKTFTSSLANYVKDVENAGLLWECLDNFVYLCEHPEARQGVAGNELIKCGILLTGIPGVGKTYFYKCLLTELGLKGVEISPKDKADNQTMLDVVRKKIKEVKASTEPCVLFIDEAEALIASRKDPNITQEQRELTDYLLQEINDLRINHPNVLIVCATNFEHKIDSAIKRQGRLDYVIELLMPNPSQREQIITDTIKGKGIKLNLNAEQIRELVELTEGLPPLVLTRTMISFSRIEGPRTGRALTFEILKELYKKEKELIVKQAERNKREGLSTENDRDAPVSATAAPTPAQGSTP